ncbi:MAG: signal recognition particle-docking protein FtsY [Treponemataceae bacterium]
MALIDFTKKLKNIFGQANKIDEDFFDALQDLLVEGDLGAKTAFEFIETLQKNCKEKKLTEQTDITNELKTIMLSTIQEATLTPEKEKTNVFMVLGVNGVGKTTCIAKMAKYYTSQNTQNICIAAADTFRAAAIDQLQIHAKNLGVRVVAHQHGSDPSAVVFDACEAITAQGGGLVLVDTAGRLHNKENLLRELQKIDRIAASKASDQCYKKILVLDCTTGQNALRQAEVFHEAVKLDGIILTKYDSTAKGGIACALGKEFNLPILFVGSGEKYSDFSPFSAEAYVDDFFST